MANNPMFDYINLPSTDPIWKWAEENVIIPPKVPTNYPGPYRSDLFVIARDVLDMLQDPAINTVIVQKGAQVSMTLTGHIWLLWCCAVDPGPFIEGLPTEDLARSQSETRVMPIFEASPALAALIPKNKKENFTKLQYLLKTCAVNWVGSNSPAQQASRAARYMHIQELDKFPRQAKEESDPINLLTQRTKTYETRKKIFMESTPTTSTGHIHQNYLTGDRRKLFMPCPHCGYMQSLSWAQVRFDSSLSIDAAALGSYYECANPACAVKKISDGAKTAMLKGREWRASGVAHDPTTVSLHLPSLYAPWVTWQYLVRKFLITKANPVQLQDFINSELGETFDKADARVTSDTLFDREGAYEEGQKWVEVDPYKASFAETEEDTDYAVLSWTDVQQNYLVTVCRVFAKNGDSGLLWYGELSGFDAHDLMVEKYKPLIKAFDKKYRKVEVHEWVFSHRDDGYMATQGANRKMSTLFDAHALDIDEGHRTVRVKGGKPRQILELTIDTNQSKDILEKCLSGHKSCPKWMIPRDYSRNRNYAQQMTSEHRVAGKWDKIGSRANHAWDAEANLIAMAIRLGFWEWRNEKKKDEGEK